MRYNCLIVTHPPLYTIGYGARTMEAFVAALRRYDIAYLIDVRSRPYSRYKPDFSREALETYLREAGIRYVFMGDTLGGRPDDPTCYDSDGKADYTKIAERPFFLAGIDRLASAHAQGLAVVVMCSEGKPEQCHRSKLIGKTLTRRGIPLAHIDENDELISQDDVVLRQTGGQRSLFGDAMLPATSRKRYRDAPDPTEEEEDE